MKKQTKSRKDGTKKYSHAGTFDNCPEKINRTGLNRGKGWKQSLNALLDGSEISIYIKKGDAEPQTLVINTKGNTREAISAILTSKALGGDLRAIDLIMDRTEGAPVQIIRSFTEEEMEAAKGKIAQAIKEGGNDE